MKPLISVLITTYNSAETIERLIVSILRQKGNETAFKLEILVADDCSTDETVAIVQNYNVVLVRNEKNSGGPNLGRNKLLKIAKGDFITYADHDDEWVLNKIETCLKYSNKVSIISSGYTIINEEKKSENKEVRNYKSGFKKFKLNETFLALLQKNYKYQITYLGTLFFSSELKNISFETIYGKADYDYQIRLFHNRNSLEIGEILHKRFIIGSNLSLNEEYRKQDLKITLRQLSVYEKQYPLEVTLGKQRAYGSIARYYYSIGKMQSARHNFRKADLGWKTILYYLTTFAGSSFVNKNFKVFG